MKKSFIIGTTILLLAGCSNSQPVSQNQSSTSPTSTLQAQAAKAKNTPEKVLEGFYRALKGKEYNKLASYITVQNLDMTQEQYVKNVEAYDFQNRIERLDILIGDLTKIDETHQWTKVMTKFKMNGKEQTGEEFPLVVLQNNEWLIDFSGIVNKKPLQLKSRTTEDNALTFSDFVVNEMFNGIQLTFQLQNNANKPVHFGLPPQKTLAKIKTDTGEYSGGFALMGTNEGIIQSGDTKQVKLTFENAKGAPLDFYLGNLYYDNAITDMRTYHVSLQ